MRICFLFLPLLLAACAMPAESVKKKEETFFLKPTVFTALPGWQQDSVGEILPALEKSCARIAKKEADKTFGPTDIGTYAEWQETCEKLPTDAANARAYFEENFTPYEIWGDKGREGLFTGYYEPMLNGSLKKSKKYNIPLYARPADLISVNLGDFKEALKGESIMGRVKKDKLVPYYTREEIEEGALKKSKKVIYVDDAVDAFFLHIQGSGQVKMKNGKVLRVGYAAANGRAYYAIGQELIKRGALTKENVSMQSIRQWLEENPDKAEEVMNLNQSYVFFNKLEGDGPLGAEGVALTPHRSLAVDRKKLPYGAPVFVDAAAPEGEGRIQKLMVAQDTGGAIRGAVRGDYFWGAGENAAHNAGIMKSAGQSYVLLPKAVKVSEKLQPKTWWQAEGDGAKSMPYNP